jgi:DNA polymerase-3 subunit delta'
MQFAAIPGHEALKATLISSFERNHIAHAQLFSGREGSAVLPMTLAYISFLFCENKKENDSCGTCSSCQKIQKSIHPDVHYFFPGPGKSGDNKEKVDKANQSQQTLWRDFILNPYQSLEDWTQSLEAENKQIQISKEDAKRIIRTVSMKSFEGSYKVIVIWYPELMHPSAANAILKVLEEPPSQTLYFLVSYHYENLLTTIRSRTQLVQIPSFNDEEVASYLMEEKGLTAEEAQRLAGFAAGNLRKALLESEDVSTIGHEEFAKWMRACLANKFDELITMAADFKAKSKSQQRIFLQYGNELIRQAVLSQADSNLVMLGEAERAFAVRFGDTLPLEALANVTQELDKMSTHLLRNANAQLTFLAASIRLSSVIKMPTRVP